MDLSRLRPYRVENTGSRPISEVKQRRAWIVLRWVTTWELQVLWAFLMLIFVFSVRKFQKTTESKTWGVLDLCVSQSTWVQAKPNTLDHVRCPKLNIVFSKFAISGKVMKQETTPSSLMEKNGRGLTLQVCKMTDGTKSCPKVPYRLSVGFWANWNRPKICPCPGGNNQADEVQTDCWLIASWKLKPIAHHLTGSSLSCGNF